MMTPGKSLTKEEHLSRTQDLCTVSPNYKIEILDGTIITPDVPDCGGRRGTIKVLQNCRQVGNAKLGEDLGRDGFRVLSFAQTQGQWLCQSARGAMGCHYFDTQPDPLRGIDDRPLRSDGMGNLQARHSEYSKAVDEIKNTAKDMASAFNARDWQQYASFLLPSFTYHAQEGLGFADPWLSKGAFLRHIQDFCAASPKCRVDILDQMVMMPDSAALSSGVWTVFQNCRQVGNVRRGNVVRDCCFVLRFLKVEKRWLCQSSQWANGCHYFDVAS